MSTCCTRGSARFRLNSIESSLATRHDQCVVDCAPKRTTSRAAGFSTTDTSRTVNCRPTLENGSLPKASISTVHPDSNSIGENATSVRTYLYPFQVMPRLSLAVLTCFKFFFFDFCFSCFTMSSLVLSACSYNVGLLGLHTRLYLSYGAKDSLVDTVTNYIVICIMKVARKIGEKHLFVDADNKRK